MQVGADGAAACAAKQLVKNKCYFCLSVFSIIGVLLRCPRWQCAHCAVSCAWHHIEVECVVRVIGFHERCPWHIGIQYESDLLADPEQSIEWRSYARVKFLTVAISSAPQVV